MGINLLQALNPPIKILMKLIGLSERVVEIEPGTLINFWAPTHSIKNYKKTESNSVKIEKIKNKPAVVLLHGFAGTGILTWLFQVAALAGKYDVYVPDLIFFGGSISDSSERSSTFQAECLARGLKLFGVEKCTVVGCSYGGMVGSRMAVLYPKLVKCLVLSNSNVGFSESHSKAALERIVGGSTSWTQFLLPNEVEGLKVLLRGVVHKTPWFPDWAYKHYLEVMFSNRKQRAELTQTMIIKDIDFTFPNFSQKIFIFAGETDKIFNLETVQKTQSELGDEKCTLICIKKAGHLVHLERPFVYNRYLNKILASIE